MMKFKYESKKSLILETPNLSTDADKSIDTIKICVLDFLKILHTGDTKSLDRCG